MSSTPDFRQITQFVQDTFNIVNNLFMSSKVEQTKLFFEICVNDFVIKSKLAQLTTKEQLQNIFNDAGVHLKDLHKTYLHQFEVNFHETNLDYTKCYFDFKKKIRTRK